MVVHRSLVEKGGERPRRAKANLRCRDPLAERGLEFLRQRELHDAAAVAIQAGAKIAPPIRDQTDAPELHTRLGQPPLLLKLQQGAAEVELLTIADVQWAPELVERLTGNYPCLPRELLAQLLEDQLHQFAAIDAGEGVGQ